MTGQGMAKSALGLLATRRLGPLCLTQGCGAFNDSLVKNALVVLALFKLGTGGTGLTAIAGALVIAPFILFSATAGQIADRFSKPRVIVIAKIAELLLMMAAAAAFLTENQTALLVLLAGLGLQATVFGPLKYGVLPEHLPDSELVAGNGAVEATTFLSILAGTVAGGALVLFDNGTTLVAAAGVGVAILGLIGALLVPPSPPANPALKIGANLPLETWRVISQAAAIRPVWLSVLGLSWFWVVGATLLTEFPTIVRDVLHAGGNVVTLLLTMFSIGVGLGSMLCAKLLKGEVSPRHVPFAALGISIFCWDFSMAASAAAGLPDVNEILSSFQGWRMLIDLLLLSACGGAFSVPLYALVQHHSPDDARARMIAANNVVNATFMVIGAAAAFAFDAYGVSSPATLAILAAANFLVAIWIVRLLPQHVLRALFRFYFNTFHGVSVSGIDNYRAAGDRVVIVSNHLSFADACLIACYLPDSPTFAVHTRMAGMWWARPFLSAVDIFKVDVQSAYSVKAMVEAVRDEGRKLMIFPEGRLTNTGALMKVYEGAAVVADKARAKILPVSIDGLQFTRLGRMKGKLPMWWFPHLAVTIMPPVDLSAKVQPGLDRHKHREALGNALQDLLVDTVFRAKQIDRTLFGALLDARAKYGGGITIAEDLAREPVSYNRLVLGAAILGRKLAAVTKPGEHVGMLLPNANGTVVTFMALQAFGRIPAMLNFSAGAEAMLSACAAAEATTIVSSRGFIEKAKLQKLIERLEQQVRILWTEDLRASITFRDKLKGKWESWFARRLPGADGSADAVGVVLFTSGSEGTPKGVALSHRNIVANCAQLSSVIDFSSKDRVFNAMPMFHSFGLTGGTLLPLLYGIRTFHYPSPLHYRVVPGLIYDTDSTICFGTDTFLNGWAKYAHAYDFYAMRYIFAGAERVRDETKRLFFERFGARILEGYGATETAPVIAMNTAMHTRAGTVGRFLPGIEWRLDPIPGIEHGGRLHVRGPNTMLGYMRAAVPGVIEPLADGWYDTGDIVEVDADGYIAIKGRAKRFAKIGGEMVSMTAAEALVASLWPDALHAVINLPDPKKGEKLLLVTTQKDAAVVAILAAARSRGVPEIMVPRDLLMVETMPLLGTGKLDYPSIQHLVAERLKPSESEDAEDSEAALP
jgi:acyl-[acyl-carrier-protein]-phospholipid O-acyltransferase / long-chain-fatty-acid--[acyl-carrier-protein] ligase